MWRGVYFEQRDKSSQDHNTFISKQKQTMGGGTEGGISVHKKLVGLSGMMSVASKGTHPDHETIAKELRNRRGNKRRNRVSLENFVVGCFFFWRNRKEESS